MEDQLREMMEAKKSVIRTLQALLSDSDDPKRIARLDGKIMAYTRVVEQLEAILDGRCWAD
jgi:hypothetical protein